MTASTIADLVLITDSATVIVRMIASLLFTLINRLESLVCMLVKKALLLVDEMGVYDCGILISNQ